MSTPITSDRAKLSTARGVINEKRYAEARRLLMTVNDPQATDWIMKIDAMSPLAPKAAKTPARVLWGALSLIAFVFAVWSVLSSLAAISYDNRALWGVFAFITLLIAYFARRLAR